jgi:hypothetical protein
LKIYVNGLTEQPIGFPLDGRVAVCGGIAGCCFTRFQARFRMFLALRVIATRIFLYGPFRIPSTSMAPSAAVGAGTSWLAALPNSTTICIWICRATIHNASAKKLDQTEFDTISAINSPSRTQCPARKLLCSGDNRDNSFDSRYWGFVRADLVIGKVVAITP